MEDVLTPSLIKGGVYLDNIPSNGLIFDNGMKGYNKVSGTLTILL